MISIPIGMIVINESNAVIRNSSIRLADREKSPLAERDLSESYANASLSTASK